MGIFDIFKKNTSVVWRNASGNITCPGDDCPQKCDETCPIWCQTMAITMMKMGHTDKAIESFKKALSIAPDFKDAWVNIAAIYGGMNNHMEANKAYRAAYTIDNNYKNAIFGLIISCKNLGQFEEALRYCDEYSRKIDKTEAEKLRGQVMEMQRNGNVARQESAVNMAIRIIEHARKDGILGNNNGFPNIPEIMAEGNRACRKIMNEMISDPEGRQPDLWLAWGAYAGMGAVYHWQVNWNALQKKGVAETLLEPRGAYAMDEYVLDTIGIKFDSDKGKELGQNIYNLAIWAFAEFLKDAPKQQALAMAFETMQAMYHFGMVYEMERLGMR